MPLPNDLDELRALQTPLIVYVGPELSHAAGLPTQAGLASILLEQLPSDTPERRRQELHELADRVDLIDAFTELEREFSPARFCAIVERALQDSELEIPLLAQLLASLGPRLQGIITPNLDRLIERAFAARLVTHVRPSLGLIQRSDWVLKTHGTLEDRSTWVFTREQHGRVLHRDPVYAEVFRAMFIGKPMLFVATTLDDPILAGVVERIRALAQHTPPRHWALLPRAELTPGARHKLGEAGISVITYETEHERLEILRSLVPKGGVAPELAPAPIIRAPPTTGPIRILFVSANPDKSEALALDREQRVIREAIERARHRDRLEVEFRTAASFKALCRAMLEHDFDIVHLAGHGDAEGLLLEDDGGQLVYACADDFASLFGEYVYPSRRLRCVVFNACWAEALGRATASIVPTTISMIGSLGDRAAIRFTEGFYDAIGAGWDFAAAYREGRRRVRVLAPHDPFDAVLLEPSHNPESTTESNSP